jgi:hypothetical protein
MVAILGHAGGGSVSELGSAQAWRRAVAVGLVYVAAAIIAVVAAVAADHVPDPLPTHWGTTGVDSVAGRGTYGWTLFAVALGAGVIATVVVRISRWDLGLRKWAVVGLGAVAWLLAGIWIATIGASWGVARAEDVVLSWWLALAFAVAAIGTLAVERTYGRVPPLQSATASSAPAPVATLSPGERVYWTTRLGSPMFLVLAIAMVAVAIAMFVLGVPVLAGVILLLGAVVVALFTSVQITVDPRGFTFGLGPVGWPRKRIPLSRIADARGQEIEPRQWGGWGYRVIPGASALVLRRGPGLVITQDDGRRFAVTLDDPDTPAGLLNALRARTTGAGDTS